MSQQWSRRSFVSLASAVGAVGLAQWNRAFAAQSAPKATCSTSFPAQDPAVTKEIVGVSHSDLKRVRELVERQPALARASIDWGFGDWEACIDAAAHVGRREIAEFLIANGARPTIFSAAMMGQLDVVKAFVAARPGVQRTYGPHGITLMAHARAGGPDAAPVVQYLTTTWRCGCAARVGAAVASGSRRPGWPVCLRCGTTRSLHDSTFRTIGWGSNAQADRHAAFSSTPAIWSSFRRASRPRRLRLRAQAARSRT